MAKKKLFEDQYGNSHENSYWRVVQLNIGVSDKNALVTFYGYKDQASREANKQSIGSKSYTISGEAFDQMYQAHLQPNGPNLMTVVYQYATNTKDEVDPNNPDNKVSFFEGAEDV